MRIGWTGLFHGNSSSAMVVQPPQGFLNARGCDPLSATTRATLNRTAS
jgi:hypothetical protein